MNSNRKAGAALVLLLAIASMGFACQGNPQQQTAQYTKDFFAAADSLVNQEIAAHDAGKIPDATHTVIRDRLDQTITLARTAERAMAAGTDSKTTLEQVRAALDSLAVNDIPVITDQGTKDSLQLAMGTLANALNIWITHTQP